MAYAQDVERRLIDTEACLREMDGSGVEMCIRSLTSPGVQGVSGPKSALALARDVNDHAAACVTAHPDRPSAFAAVPLQNPRAAADELGPDGHVQYLDEEPVREFWARVEKLHVPVYWHPRQPLPSQRRAIQGYPELVGPKGAKAKRRPSYYFANNSTSLRAAISIPSPC